ncbi:endonuclease-8 [Kitasatospora sp. GP30]|nr:endonuclease-8 [Kitasatospora sp. GP30]
MLGACPRVTPCSTAAQLHQALAGRVLTTADLRVPAHATARLTGRQVLEVCPRGKHLLMRVEGGLTLHTHLRMDGRWQVYRTGERCTGGPGHQIRAVLGNAEWTAVGYRLPVLELLPTTAEAEVVGHLGPDLLGPDWSVEEALRRLAAAPERPTGEALLDQRNLAGIGNVYAKKLCRACGLTVRQGLSHPLETVTSSHRSGRRPTLRPGPVGRSRWPLARTNGSGGVGAGSMTAPARISSWRSGPPPPPASTAPRRQRCRTASSSRRSA